MKRHFIGRGLTAVLLALVLTMPLMAGGKLLSGREMVAAAKTEIIEVLIDDLMRVLSEGKDVVILDVREPAEVEKGMVPMAVHVPRGLLEFRVGSAVPEAVTTVYVYCKSGGRSALATKTLEDMGYLNVYSVAGGFDAWKKAGYPTQ